MTRCDITPWAAFEAEGRTSHWEGGRGVNAKRTNDTHVKLFRSDTAEFRAKFGNRKSCDCIFLIEKAKTRRLIFVELKGRNVEEAAEQLLQTVLAVQRQLPAGCRDSTMREVIVAGREAPPAAERPKLQKDFQRKTGLVLSFRSVPNGKSLTIE